MHINIMKKSYFLICSKCDLVKYKNRWVKKSLEELNKEGFYKVKKTICPNCSRKFGGYYEAILQLRGLSTEVIDFTENRLENISKNDRKAFYKIESVKNGFDIYIGSKSAAKKVSELVKRNFNLKIIKSYKLVTRREGRDVHRTVISLKP